MKNGTAFPVVLHLSMAVGALTLHTGVRCRYVFPKGYKKYRQRILFAVYQPPPNVKDATKIHSFSVLCKRLAVFNILNRLFVLLCKYASVTEA